MKNEGRIMTETGGKEGANMNELNKEPNKRNTELKTEAPEKTVVKNTIAHNTQEPESAVKSDKSEESGNNTGKDMMKALSYENIEKVKRLKDFSVEVEINGEKQVKTGHDVLEAMGKLGREDLTSEEKQEVMPGSAKLWGELAQRYKAESEQGKELRSILFNNTLAGGDKEKGEKLYGWFQSQANAIKEGGGMRIDLTGLGEIMGLKLDGSKTGELGKLIKQVSLPDGVGAASMVTVGEDGQITITPAPQGEEKEVTPGISETSGIPQVTGDKLPSEGGRKKKEEEEEEKKKKDKFNWAKWGNAFLFLFICYLVAQGWYAKMWEQMAERAR